MANSNPANQYPICHLCGGQMVKKSIRKTSAVGLGIGIIFIIIGISLTITVIGAILGLPLIIIGLFCGAKSKKVLKCSNCGAAIDRA